MIFKIAAALLLIGFQASSAIRIPYSLLVANNGSCYPKDSCSAPSRTKEDDHLWGEYTCDCGTYCTLFSTCCIDSPYSASASRYRFHSILQIHNACHKLPSFSHSVIVINQCSGRFPYDERVREECEGGRSFEEDPVALAPVTSLTTYLTYKNYFCATCNNDTSDLRTWDIEIRTKGQASNMLTPTDEELLSNLVYDANMKSWSLSENDKVLDVKLVLRVPPNLRKMVKKCYPDMVNECPLDYHSDRVRHACFAYYAPLKLKDASGQIRYYRNFHCALCNGASPLSQEDGFEMCNLDDVSRARNKFSFALLLDVNTSDGDRVGKKQLCGEGQKWDPFFKKCRNLACALPGHVLKDGKCVQN